LILHYIRKLLCKLELLLLLQRLLKRRFLKTFPTCKIVSNIVTPPDPLGTMSFIDLILHYVRKLSCKFELFWIIGSWEQDFWMTPPYICILWLSPLWWGSVPLSK
jgi:hypothetical protein